MKDRRVLLAAGLGATLAILGALAWWLRPTATTLGEDPDIPALPEPTIEETPELRRVELYFPGEDGRLHGLARELPVSPEPAVNVLRMVEALLEGPHGEFAPKPSEPESDAENDTRPEAENAEQIDGEPPPVVPIELIDLNPADGLWPPLPADVHVGQAYLMDGVGESGVGESGATVIVDLIVPEHAAPMSGARAEILMIYSLVNTVLLNTMEAERIVLLWNGQQRSTFAGHFDTTRPLTPKTELIAR